MTTTDYVIDIALILLVIRQLVPQRLHLRSIVLPLGLIAFAGTNYLRSFPLGGNDLTLIVLLVLVGVGLGVASGFTTQVWRNETSHTMCQAGIAAAGLWILGMGFRLAFGIWSTHGGQESLARFSLSHQITSGQAWTTALVLMAFGQVIVRVVILQIRRLRLELHSTAPAIA
ncbi:MAG TPA: hypothetical protein VFG33_07130 [Kribbella sp.]|uniref:hypothetical protein n=1 Tax=Kribbella sp. TaxID=1871183 RepID=UPI002D790F70|nr:hypothetical protein [Kribbella sp.]HET6293129.1 hypothetical protein [Kribbella sp.]